MSEATPSEQLDKNLSLRIVSREFSRCWLRCMLLCWSYWTDEVSLRCADSMLFWVFPKKQPLNPFLSWNVFELQCWCVRILQRHWREFSELRLDLWEPRFLLTWCILDIYKHSRC